MRGACVQVLTTGSWPSSAASACALPAELEAGTRVFDEFYRAKHNGRQLTWHLQMGTADLACTIAGKRHTISVTTHQMCVLMLLNGQPSITFRELAEVRPVPLFFFFCAAHVLRSTVAWPALRGRGCKRQRHRNSRRGERGEKS